VGLGGKEDRDNSVGVILALLGKGWGGQRESGCGVGGIGNWRIPVQDYFDLFK
jgi:hypothetical protein